MLNCEKVYGVIFLLKTAKNIGGLGIQKNTKGESGGLPCYQKLTRFLSCQAHIFFKNPTFITQVLRHPIFLPCKGQRLENSFIAS
jgi:hypothetical protein